VSGITRFLWVFGRGERGFDVAGFRGIDHPLISGEQRVFYGNKNYNKKLWIYFRAEVVRINLVL
jgi:hypothetical protein